jgi:CheY-like chemotaxis protein
MPAWSKKTCAVPTSPIPLSRSVTGVRRWNTYSGDPIPANLPVLLDLNLPVMDGYQVLRRMKGNASTRRIPVIVLTTTDDEREIDRCYDLGCNVYITKPVDYEGFSEAIRKLGLFLSVVAIPKERTNNHE